MAATKPITFVVSVSSRGEVLETNLLASSCLRAPHSHQILVQEGFASASAAYNDAIDKSINDLMVFCHQDVFFPDSWLSQLERALESLELRDPGWGVLGCAGVTRDRGYRGHVYSNGMGVLGMPFEHPAAVQTLHELVLILRKSSGLRFDEALPHFYLHGADICQRAAKRGMSSYAISAFCIHNTERKLLSPEFYECCKHMKRVWKDCLPIQTTCIRITRFNLPLYKQRLREAYLRYIPHVVGVSRVKDVQRVLEELAGKP